jgi:indole-3-glycerol phosphate synthase
MDNAEGYAPEIKSILRAARTRPGGDSRLSVDPRSLTDAFATARREGRVPLIAEVKPTSPTTDGTRDADPVGLAEEMVAGGAAALSVLTEPDHFGGDPDDLRRIRDAVGVPVLRKDFVIREEQLDTVAADVVLVIARFVDDLDGMIGAARDRGFQVLVEAHTRDEVREAVRAGAEIIGINNRDLANLVVDLSTFEQVADAAPDDVTLVAESGITTPSDVTRMQAAGADGLLVGSAIMGGDVRTNTRTLTEVETT